MRLKKKSMQKDERRHLKLGSVIITLIFASFFFVNCTAYNPSAYVSYDVLNPGVEVEANPLGFVVFDSNLGYFIISWEDGITIDSEGDYAIINRAFYLHYRELWDEIIKLRKLIK